MTRHFLPFKNAQELESILQAFVGKCQDHGIQCEPGQDGALLLFATRDVMEREATHCGLIKPLKGATPDGMATVEPFDVDARDLYKGLQDPHFFRPSESAWLTHRILASLQVRPAAANTLHEVAVRLPPLPIALRVHERRRTLTPASVPQCD